MWKGFLHTPRYSYYDMMFILLGAAAYSDKQYGLWIGTIIFLIATGTWIEYHYTKKKD